MQQNSKKTCKRSGTGTTPTTSVVDYKQETRFKNENDEEAKTTTHRKETKADVRRDDAEEESEMTTWYG